MGIVTNEDQEDNLEIGMEDNLEIGMVNSELGTDITQVAPCNVGTTTDNLAVTASRVSLNN